MFRVLLIPLAVSLLAASSAALVWLAPVASGGGAPPVAAWEAGGEQPSIMTTGEGSAVGRPDQASLSFGVQATRPSAAEALTEANRATEALLVKLDEAGIPRGQVETSGLSLFPVQEPPRAFGPPANGDPSSTGYQAVYQMSVRIDDLNRVGHLLDGVVTAGAIQVTGVRFERRETGSLRAQALREAVRDARVKADILAAALNRKTGPVLAVREENGGMIVPFSAPGNGNRTAEVPVEAGQLILHTRVQVTFSLSAGS